MYSVSVILTTYNRAHYIEQALQSVFEQTLKNYEVIVVDDGSTDNTREVLTPYMDRIRYIYQENSGTASGARNTGIRAATADWIAFLDSDDIWEPRFLETHISAAHEHPEVGIVYSDYYQFEEGHFSERRLIRVPGRDNDHPETYPIEHFTNFYTALDGVLFRRRCLEEIGLFDVQLVICEDWDVIMRIALRWGAYFVDYPGVNVRIHRSNTMKARTKAAKSVIQAYRKLALDVPEFRRKLGSIFDKAMRDRQCKLAQCYLEDGRIRDARSLTLSAIRPSSSYGSVRARFKWITIYMTRCWIPFGNSLYHLARKVRTWKRR